MDRNQLKRSITTSRYLIVNADDFGLSDGVNEGIVKAWCDGVVTSTSVLINIEGAPERAAAAHAAHPELPMGLHLNITTGRPVLPVDQVPTLVDADGRFHSYDTIIKYLPNISLSELRAELNAQAELLVASGVQFDHIDYHFHLMALYTPFWPAVRELALKYDVPVRQPVPESLYGQVKLKGRSAATIAVIKSIIAFGIRHPILTMRLVSHMMPAAYKRQAALLEADGVTATDWFIDAYYGNATLDRFISVIRQLPPGVSEVAVHPAIVDDQLHSVGAIYVEERAEELSVLLDPRVRDAFIEYNVQPVDFSFVKSMST